MPMKRYKSAARCLCPTRREPRANMRDLNLLSQISKKCLSKRHICDMQFADVAWALKTQTAINQAWPNAVFGLRPRLSFLLIPYIHIFVLHRRLYERKRRTTLEQAIYEEMELTPEMIRSIRTLCGVCLCSFVESKAFKIAIVPSADRSMDTCTVCQTRRGHDYVVMNR